MFISSYPLFILPTIIWTIGEILVVTNFGVYLADNSPSNFRARFNAVGSLSWSIGAALGTSVAGKFIQEIGLDYIWLLTLILSIIGIAECIVSIWREREREIQQKQLQTWKRKRYNRFAEFIQAYNIIKDRGAGLWLK